MRIAGIPFDTTDWSRIEPTVLLCLEGELDTETANHGTVRLTPGMSYQAADGAAPHRSSTRTGARLFVVD